GAGSERDDLAVDGERRHVGYRGARAGRPTPWSMPTGTRGVQRPRHAGATPLRPPPRGLRAAPPNDSSVPPRSASRRADTGTTCLASAPGRPRPPRDLRGATRVPPPGPPGRARRTPALPPNFPRAFPPVPPRRRLTLPRRRQAGASAGRPVAGASRRGNGLVRQAGWMWLWGAVLRVSHLVHIFAPSTYRVRARIRRGIITKRVP